MSNTSNLVTLTIDGKQVTVPDTFTVLEAAQTCGVHIPTLCWMKDLNEIGSCRMCVVDIEGKHTLSAACNTYACDGMVVHSTTPRVIEARRGNLNFILENHRTSCTTCQRSGTCALQEIAEDFAMDDLKYPEHYEEKDWDETLPLQRDASKCIRCMRCVVECAKVQHCEVWEMSGPEQYRTVRKTGNGCAQCGQCVTHCPTGALTARNDINRVMRALADPDTLTVVQTAPAVRAAWGEGVGLSHKNASLGKLADALKRLGFDYVYDTIFGADLTIMEEGSEVIEWLKSGKKRPMFTSCCPGWVRFAKLHYPDFVEQLSSSKSPHQMQGAFIKHTHDKALAESGKKRIFVVSIMPCMAKKYECDVPQLSTDRGRDVDAVLTTRELDTMIRLFGIDASTLQDVEFDSPLGTPTGAGTIFGRTGGVMEAALRTACYLLTGENPDFSTCDTTQATPERPWSDKQIEVAGLTLSIAVTSGLENTAKLLDALRAGEVSYDFVEVMACPGGCVGGGGQPITFNQEMWEERASVLNSLDKGYPLRRSHENPDVERAYQEWVGEPLSETAEAWLHTDQEAWDI
ncbi:MAG: [FeFe] hydrogenase, group A [Eggerthellaceae bacterium]